MENLAHAYDPWLWPAFIGGVILLIAVDLLMNRNAHEIKAREALILSAIWISIALAFNAWFGMRYGKELGIQFLTGYLIEKSLSVDNLFVILLVFQALKIPQKFQRRVLTWGIMGAILMRGVLIILGAELVERFSWILYGFGAILIYSGAKFFFESEHEDEVKDHWAVSLVHKFVPVTKELDGQHFFTTVKGVVHATPLFVALVVVEVSDLIFAVDSIPAVFAVTQDAFVAFSSNILAILGLRALYFLLADWVGKLRYLKPGLAAILMFVGVKMLIVEFYHIPSWVSLLVLSGILTTAALTSWWVARNEERQS